MPEDPTPQKFTIELTAEEARLLSTAASRWADEFARSYHRASPDLRAAWEHNATVLRHLATELAKLK
jgi:hypothetical protein